MSLFNFKTEIIFKYAPSPDVPSPDGGGGGVLGPNLGTHCGTDPKSDGGDKQRQKSGDRPIPLNTRAVGDL